MLAKKLVLHIDILPDELVKEILRHATWVPYDIDPSDMVPKRIQSSRYKDVIKQYRSSLVRLSFLTVSSSL